MAILCQVLPLVLELGQDIIWRVRRAVMVSVPLLTERMGVNYFEENLLELYLQVWGLPFITYLSIVAALIYKPNYPIITDP